MFSFGKKKKTCGSCRAGAYGDKEMEEANAAKGSGAPIKILGSGCAKCRELEENTRSALKELGMDTPVEHISEFAQIAAYGVMTTPALVIDGKVVSFGKALKTAEIVKLLQKSGE